VSDPYDESGFRIANQNQLYYARQSSYMYAGSAGLHERVSNGLITLSQVNGQAFVLNSIDLSILANGGTSPAVTFTGLLSGGGTVTQSFTPTVFGFRTFTFNSTFTNLTSVSWRQGTGEGNAHQFDNIVLNANAVPEPASLATAGLGVLMGLGYAWRRKRAA
jgi:hypothetical protein